MQKQVDYKKLCELAEVLELNLMIEDDKVDHKTFYDQSSWSDRVKRVLKINVNKRLKYLGLLEKCSRCNGSGSYSYNARNGSICFGCDGEKVSPIKNITNEFIKEVQQLVNSGMLEGYKRELSERK